MCNSVDFIRLPRGLNTFGYHGFATTQVIDLTSSFNSTESPTPCSRKPAMQSNERANNTALNDSSQPVAAKQVFLCYCSQDLHAAERLQVHLAGCQHLHHLTVWDNARLPAGSSWQSEMAAALASAQVAVVLVSADFLATPLIATYQLPLLLEAAQTRGTHILSVILSPCLFEESPLAAFQPINPVRPLSLLSRSQRDAVWVTVVRVIVSALMHL